jgi:hypothetical protein
MSDLFRKQAMAKLNSPERGDDVVELTGVVGVTGIVLAGSSVAAAIGDIFVI